MKNTFSILLFAVLFCAMSNFTYSQNVNVTPSAATYATLGAAFTAINAGTHGAGAVVVSIKGNTTELATATLNGGVFTTCSITPVGARIVTGDLAASVINFNGADNVTINGLNASGNSLTVVNPNVSTGANGVQCSNGASNNIIRNLTVVGLGASGGAAGGRGVNIGQSIVATGGNNDNIIEDCLINGFRRGIQVFGTDGNAVFGFFNDRNIIRRNKVKNSTSLYIFIGTATRDNVCEMNEVFSDAAVINDAAGTRAINVQGLGNNIVRQNKVHSLTGTVAGGFIGIITIPAIVLAPLTSPAQNTVNVTNNFVALDNTLAAAPFVYGIFPTSNANTEDYTANIYFNSIRIGGSSGATAAALSIGLEQGQDGLHGPDTTRICNNIVINERLGGDAASRHVGSDLNPANGVSLESDYNTVFASDTTGRGWAAGYNGTLYRGPGGNQLYWDSTINAGIERLTVFDNTHYVSNTDLHLAGKVAGNMAAKEIPGITTDIDGDSRAITATNLFTYRGADEHLPTGGAAWRKGTRTILISYQGTNFFGREGRFPGTVGEGIPDVDVSVGTKPNGIICHSVPDTVINNVVTFKINFGDSVTASNYYLDLGFTNSLRTLSGLPLSFTAITGSYNFTTSLSQAYGNNMFGSSPPFQIYTGDVNQDEVIDISDAAKIDNDASNFKGGLRILTDVNFDQVVDLSDAAIVDNNASNFISAIIPPGFSNAPMNLKLTAETKGLQNLDRRNTIIEVQN